MSRRARIVAAALGAACALPAAAAAAAPTDPFFDQQWALARESALGRAAAWQQSTGAGALVAVLDTGADLGHADLQGAFWTNPAEIADNGADDDRNGYVDDVHGADVVNDDGDPADDEGHGTHVAGIIAARTGNGVGGAGLAPDARIMVVKVLDDRRAGTAGGLAEGIRYALDHGARIINTSVNGDGTSRPLQEAIRAADAAGALVIASAGNHGRSIDAQPSYPAAYTDPAIVTVGSVGETGALSAFSNHGVLSVDVAAPGEDILSTAGMGGQELRSGTSMAAPFVSATLALMHSARPDLDGAALKAALLGAARPGLLDGLVGAGSLDPSAALRGVLGSAGRVVDVAPLAVRAMPAARTARGAVIAWTVGGDTAAVAALRVTVGHRVVADRAVAATGRVRVRARPGAHAFRVQALDAAGEVLTESAGAFRVSRADWRRRAKAARVPARSRHLP